MSEKKLRRRCAECREVFDVMPMKASRSEWDEVLSKIDPWSRSPGGYNVVSWTTDPFEEHMSGDCTKKWLCEYCCFWLDEMI